MPRATLMGENHFDRLSDDLLRLIFNRVLDANSLCCCLSVSKRFASIVPQTKSVSLAIASIFPLANGVSLVIPRRSVVKQTREDTKSKTKIGGLYGKFLKILMKKVITKPLRFLHHTIACNSSSTTIFDLEDEEPSYLFDEVLRSFDEIESLKIILPENGPEIGLDRGERDDAILKWKAEFGSEFKSCVILYASSFKKTEHLSGVNFGSNYSIVEEGMENAEASAIICVGQDELNSQITITLSLLLSALARHYLLKHVIVSRPMLRRVEVTDDKQQGRLCMNEEQIVETRKSFVPWSPLGRFDTFPGLDIKIRHVPVLELPETGMVMEGATLVVVRAVDDGVGQRDQESDDGEDLFEGAFDGDEEAEALAEAVRELMKKNTTFTYESD